MNILKRYEWIFRRCQVNHISALMSTVYLIMTVKKISLASRSVRVVDVRVVFFPILCMQSVKYGGLLRDKAFMPLNVVTHNKIENK